MSTMPLFDRLDQPAPVAVPVASEGSWLFGDDAGDPDGVWWMQREAIDAIGREHETLRSTLVVMATGCGKTTVFGVVAKHFLGGKGRVLVLAHRDELVKQARKRIEKMTGEWVEVEKAELRSSKHTRLVVGSVQTLCKPNRLAALGKNRFDLIVIDECHHAISPSYRAIIDYFSDAKVLGVTATPDRGDKLAMGIVFESVAYTFDIVDGIDHGYLVPIIGDRQTLTEINLEGVTKSAGDLAMGQLDEVILKAVEGVVKKTLELYPDRQGIVFFPGVKSAELACARFNDLSPGCACWLSAKTDEDERARIVRDFGLGKYRYLCNVGIATEGFDAPAVSLVVLARPTLSRALYAQMVGRGTRILSHVIDGCYGREMAEIRRALIAASSKPNMVILDFVGNSGKHDLANATELLGGRYTDEEIKRAKKKAKTKKGNGQDPRELLEQSRRELAAIASSMRSQVKSKGEAFDPFAVTPADVSDVMPEMGHQAMPTAMRNTLTNYGLLPAEMEGMNRGDGERFIRTQQHRHMKGLATYKQLKALQRHGVNQPEIKKDRASAVLTYIQGKRGRDINPKVIDAIVHSTKKKETTI